MPYDSRPISNGGNREMGEEFSRNAPEGKFRVVSVDTFDGSDGVVADCNTLQEAKKLADELGGSMLKVYIYDDKGRYLHEAGSF